MHPGARVSSQRELHQVPILRHLDPEAVLAKKITPPFRPPKDHLNCDPSLELEEMIVEAKPLHKKKKRLAKQRSLHRDPDSELNYSKEFLIYNRFKEVQRREMEQKERDWERELAEAMANSEVNQETTAKTPVKRREEEEGGVGGGVKREGGAASSGAIIDFIDRTPSPKPRN